MQYRPLVSVVVTTSEDTTRLPRSLWSLSAQTLARKDMEVLFVSDGSSAMRRLGEMWSAILHPTRFRSLAPRGLSGTAELRNHGLDHAQGEFVLVLGQDTRLEPDYLESALAAMHTHGADAVFTDIMTPAGLVLLPDFNRQALQKKNIVGPMALMRSNVVQHGCRYRTNTAYLDWDFWIQAAADGYFLHHLPQALSITDLPADGISARLREVDGRSKAMLVINNAGFFEQDVVRWALALLRGELWVQAHEPGLLPDRSDVRSFLQRYTLATRGLEKRMDHEPSALDRPALARRLFCGVC